MVKNVKKFMKESEKEHKKYLKNLSIKKAASIMETLLTSKLWKDMFYKHADKPTSIRYTLKHAK